MDFLSLGFNGPSPFGGLTQDQIDSGVYDPVYNPIGDVIYMPSTGIDVVPGIYSPPITGPVVQSQSPWPQLIAADVAAGLKAISSIFSPAAASVAQAQSSQPQYVYRPQQTGAYYPGTTAPTSASSAGFDSSGINLFGSHIGWWPIAIVALGFYLLQSRPVGRR